VINPGVELAAFDGALEAGQDYRTQRGWQGKQVVLTLARMDARKNQAMVLRAVAALKEKYPNMIYVCAGGGQMKERLQALTTKLGISDRVEFPGEVDGATKMALYGCCDLFAMPAIQVGTDVEGFGMVFIEAGACGKPCVAGSSGGQAEAVIDGQTGFVIDGNELDAVTGALDRLLADPVLRQRMGDSGPGLATAHGRSWANEGSDAGLASSGSANRGNGRKNGIAEVRGQRSEVRG